MEIPKEVKSLIEKLKTKIKSEGGKVIQVKTNPLIKGVTLVAVINKKKVTYDIVRKENVRKLE